MNTFEILFGGERYLYLTRGLEVTLLLTVFSTIIGIAIGLVIALMQQSQWQPFKHHKLGRAYIYALAAAGEAGVENLLTLMEKEMRVAMSWR